ncbi:hypothetical protein THAOC_15166 [Thalassiosira oceanica]|uniref:Uncharacterized protein n=1 Tax=Thalassiosira oceanica TaxID=159749 RepID=K0SGM3_THAOC|nr:hypothetical protein THAOC_15166 [Thalassiosira oceanica]|eukprot:EJK64129.1 hypothetical protein THAOC_15166 [Thalassiosira oceanica]
MDQLTAASSAGTIVDETGGAPAEAAVMESRLKKSRPHGHLSTCSARARGRRTPSPSVEPTGSVLSAGSTSGGQLAGECSVYDRFDDAFDSGSGVGRSRSGSPVIRGSWTDQLSDVSSTGTAEERWGPLGFPRPFPARGTARAGGGAGPEPRGAGHGPQQRGAGAAGRGGSPPPAKVMEGAEEGSELAEEAEPTEKAEPA